MYKLAYEQHETQQQNKQTNCKQANRQKQKQTTTTKYLQKKKKNLSMDLIVVTYGVIHASL